jgi:hypothetical protein
LRSRKPFTSNPRNAPITASPWIRQNLNLGTRHRTARTSPPDVRRLPGANISNALSHGDAFALPFTPSIWPSIPTRRWRN